MILSRHPAARRLLGALGLLLLTVSCVHAQPRTNEAPRLVVAISIDQFRQNFLHRFRPGFGERGFNLLLEQGAAFADAHYRTTSTPRRRQVPATR